MRKVDIVSGVSGSGKTMLVGKLMLAYTNSLGLTFDEIAKLPKSDKRATAALCSADLFFMGEGGSYNFDVSKLSEAHGSCFKNYIESMQNRTEYIVVDNTNTTAEEIAPYILGAQAFGYEVEIKTILCTPNDLERFAARNRHGVPLRSIVQQYNRISTRTLPPWWKESFVPNDSWSLDACVEKCK
jgi:predicted ABC-type ATPase